MNLIRAAIGRRERWIEAIDRERDLTMRQLASPLRRKHDDRDALQRRCDALDRERADVLRELAQLRPLEFSAASMFSRRPRRVLPPLPLTMAKATGKERKRKGA